jgi:CrcB protein
MTFAVAVVAGAFGALARYIIDGAVQDRVEGVFPWGTFVINVSGSLVLGLLVGLRLYHGLPDAPVAVLGVGFCGAFTTFSTFTYETIRLVEDGARVDALMNVLANAAGSLLAGGLGLALASLLP